MATIRQCLAALGVTTAEVFAGCGGTAEEVRAPCARVRHAARTCVALHLARRTVWHAMRCT